MSLFYSLSESMYLHVRDFMFNCQLNGFLPVTPQQVFGADSGAFCDGSDTMDEVETVCFYVPVYYY